MEIKVASINDWPSLNLFYNKIYRQNHPLQNKLFWEWQYGDPNYGRSFICKDDNGEIVGHVGASFGGGIAWIINVFLSEKYRGKGILTDLYKMAREYHPLAATAANDAGLRLYRNMRWIRYHNLVRLVKINPICKNTFEEVCVPKEINAVKLNHKDNHYFKQPSLKGIEFIGQTTAVDQSEVGGARIVDLNENLLFEEEAWEMGYNWMDYITSWNDLKCRKLEEKGWQLDSNTCVPWLLNPLEKGRYSNISFLSETALPNDFIVHRSYSDHGRIGSL
ncbi:hypothetical protein AEM51_03660 [Bacteroidetes bacterium UKL13-3]|nr:hypothetical protein AEM51_03660 [Bacteroidetes bacterium UKL13-3]HCP94715.1 hypothetical protein [Bacteroidota bacterium]